MTSITTTHRDSTAQVAVGTVAGAVALNALGIFGDGTAGAEHSTGEFWVVTGVIVAAAALVFGVVVRRLEGSPRAGTVGLVLAGLAVLLVVPAYWSGLPVVLGVGGIVLGQGGRAGTDRSGRGSAAVALGVLATMAAVAIYLADWLGTNGVL